MELLNVKKKMRMELKRHIVAVLDKAYTIYAKKPITRHLNKKGKYQKIKKYKHSPLYIARIDPGSS